MLGLLTITTQAAPTLLHRGSVQTGRAVRNREEMTFPTSDSLGCLLFNPVVTKTHVSRQDVTGRNTAPSTDSTGTIPSLSGVKHPETGTLESLSNLGCPQTCHTSVPYAHWR